VTPDGIVVDLPLTHELIGRLVGGRRPTVTLALAELAENGVLVRRDEGGWLLPRTAAATA
jgi:DNA-binding GntR family transcriptional regulator